MAEERESNTTAKTIVRLLDSAASAYSGDHDVEVEDWTGIGIWS